MSRFYWICFIVLLVIPKPIYAQADGWSTGCDAKAKPIIAATTKLNYGAGCKIYTTCTDAGGSVGVCQMRALMTLQKGCANAQCKIEAELYAASIPVFNNLYNFSVFNNDKSVATVEAAVPKALAAFQAGKYDDAAKLYLGIPTDVYIHPMLPLSAGLAYVAAGESIKALAAYEQAVQTSYFEPLSYYVHGNALVGTHQHEDEAAIDFSLLAQYAAGEAALSSLDKPLVDAHPFPTALFKNWMAYPVVWRGGGVAGDSMTDMTQDASRAISIAKLDGGKKLAVQNSVVCSTKLITIFLKH